MSEISSDILEDQFGPTEICILRQDDKERIICTKALDGGQVLELSFVTFRKGAADAFPDVHREVLGGKSMGKAFREHGVPFKRRTRAVHSYEPDEVFIRRFGVSGLATAVDVSILAGPEDTPYAYILEVYSPAVSWPQAGGPADKTILSRLHAFGELLTDLND